MVENGQVSKTIALYAVLRHVKTLGYMIIPRHKEISYKEEHRTNTVPMLIVFSLYVLLVSYKIDDMMRNNYIIIIIILF